MISLEFSLIPFPSPVRLPDMAVSGSIGRRASVLSANYRLAGSLSGLVIPLTEAMPGRRDSLWEKTCFEFFVSTAGSEAYREFNISPAGNWNVYGFGSYRASMQEEPAVDLLDISIDYGPDALILSAEFDLGCIIGPEQPLEIGVSAVIETGRSEKSYWALTHPAPRPDFHLRESFLLKL